MWCGDSQRAVSMLSQLCALKKYCQKGKNTENPSTLLIPGICLIQCLDAWRSLRVHPWLRMFYGATASMFARAILAQEHPSLSYDMRFTLHYRAAIHACLWAQSPALPLPVFSPTWRLFYLLSTQHWRFPGVNCKVWVGMRFRWGMLITIWLAKIHAGSFFFNSSCQWKTSPLPSTIQ